MEAGVGLSRLPRGSTTRDPDTIVGARETDDYVAPRT